MTIDRTTQKRNDREVVTSLLPTHENFDFQLWAVAVRFQMLAVLKKSKYPATTASQ
ncbi:hypothetical protein HC931_22470 [Candidatus Gracilibacteria bacterium]|nr:hypothetical protein [Candidatus Gracilibacteria bacterium]NJM89325.1 hypothetical protein [Hydrococcus sp. RU_2_2]NJP21040.1 hypothetical protein [Hydrococcus sp. CRU_1_1]NJQ98040.1 hypothetical protein [Hydrococcus sp. CSU_1_8]